jgi:hypothetical protein
MLNEGLWIDTTFDPCQFSLDYPFKQFCEVAYFGAAPIVRDHTVPPFSIYPTACPTTYSLSDTKIMGHCLNISALLTHGHGKLVVL